MKSLKGTETEKNLLTAFAGESQARNRYSYFASQAKKEGYEQMAAIFLDTADNEKEHAKVLFKLLEGGEAAVSASFPAGVIAGTTANLLEAANGEHHEYAEMYPSFAEVARKEGFAEIAETFLNIAKAEMGHEKRFLTLKKNIDDGAVFKRGGKVVWRCRNCGYMHEGNEAPAECPACKHEQAYFEVFGEVY
ncbi:MAG: rubrerythrin family protein [Methanothrix sp.]|nr:rubrerythrin family protein [Methanothrix sp.]OYV10679.1 MAG: rubrerythrin [Methanosaeta sp. NSP1]OYV12107.1 MAG: rubrerythrin [Methanosaeta sp. NSM2]OYV13515.1 MAG: rubrerythrin [Methanosaeta sp. ASO1]MDD1731744.1 rubrerythrin family protein [Methanothrix sp.]